jgi:putative hydrolase of the HAD superfamily
LLKKNGHTLGLVSNFTPDLPRILEKQGLKQYFECIVVSSVVGVWKPNPKIMTFATNELSIPAEECVYIGDNPFDVQCSKDAGMMAIWLNHDNREMPAEISHEPDAVIRKLGDVTDLI